jgi:hypothetical protein
VVDTVALVVAVVDTVALVVAVVDTVALVVAVVDTVALVVVLIQMLRFSPVSNIPPLLHTNLHLYIAFIRRTSGRSLLTFQQSDALSAIPGSSWQQLL